MPRLGFGTSGIKDAEIIEKAIKIGYRHLDTASFYQNEEIVGQGVKSCVEGGVVSREEMFVTTKIWHTEYEDPEQALRNSLAKLQLEYVDLYLIHWPNNGFTTPKVPLHVLWPKLETLVDSGLTKAIGVSNFNV